MFASTSSPSASKERRFSFDPALFQEKLQNYCSEAIAQFKRITRYYAIFHMAFFGLAISLLFCFLLFFSFFTQSAMLAFFLAALFLTGFSYFVLLFYFQAKKPEQLTQLRNTFVDSCLSSLPYSKDSPESHVAISYALSHLAALLHRQEYNYYPLPTQFKNLSPLIEKFSVWTHWKDLHQMKEMLLLLSIHEHICLVKAHPTDLEAHAALAVKYIDLSRIYKDPKDQDGEPIWIPADYSTAQMKDKFRLAAERAIEEFIILNDYVPNDPWVHAQLASLYHNLGRFELEIQEYETLLRISPHDKEVLFRLGVLYFQQGHNAKGLKIYEQLQRTKEGKSEELISFYDAFLLREFELEGATR